MHPAHLLSQSSMPVKEGHVCPVLLMRGSRLLLWGGGLSPPVVFAGC